MEDFAELITRVRAEHPLPPVADGPITWATLAARQDRNDLPRLAISRWFDLPERDRPTALTAAWTLAEFPEHHARSSVWATLFEDVGYLVDGIVMPRQDDPGLPGELITAWRGATYERRAGMSWTTSREHAEWFRDRFINIGGTQRTHLFRIHIPTEYVLARFTGRGEHEVVIATEEFDEDEYVLEV